MKRILLTGLVALGLSAFVLAADDPNLVQTLSKQLNVSEDQAAGGAGAIFQYAKGALSGDDYGKVVKAVPEAADLEKKAPAVDSTTAVSASDSARSASRPRCRRSTNPPSVDTWRTWSPRASSRLLVKRRARLRA